MSLRSFPLAIVTGILLGVLACAASAQDGCDSTGDCLLPHGKPGCSDPSCCATVCDVDPFCCASWDADCVSYANATCVGLCGADASGSCFLPHPNPACSDADCCDGVCLIDPYCCAGAWDTSCVFLAGFSCSTGGGECGDPQAGDCFQPNGTPACDDAACCNAVCDIDPRCCDVVWDAICVSLAEAACLGGCEISAPVDAVEETEGCDTSTNDPCDGGAPQVVEGLPPLAGRFRNASDVDVFEFDLAALDLDGDGLVRVRIDILASSSANVSIGSAGCGVSPDLVEDAPSCVDRFMETCVAAGPIWLRVEATATPMPCNQTGYVARMEVRDTCDDPCGTGGDCLVPSADAGCGDAACCAAVCELDPHCCDWEWDASCAVQAAATCGGPAPVNDACADAIDALLGLTPFRQLLSTPDGPAEWCGPDGDAGGDVWFRHTVRCTGSLYIGTCNAADFDTVVQVFRGDCTSGLETVACVDDADGCGLGTGLVEITDATCGETLMIRVLAADGPGGNGQLAIDCFGGTCPCPADLDGDGVVGGADLGRLFSAWGPCRKGCEADLDGDGAVGGSDLGLMFSAWGPC